jgi:hypothetical protein
MRLSVRRLNSQPDEAAVSSPDVCIGYEMRIGSTGYHRDDRRSGNFHVDGWLDDQTMLNCSDYGNLSVT